MSPLRQLPVTPASLAGIALAWLAAAHVSSSTQAPTSDANDASVRVVRLETNAATRHLPIHSWCTGALS